jgi:hypothetical protein
MRLPKHKLPKIKSQHSQKDKVGQKLKAKIEKKAAKVVKAAQMAVENEEETNKEQLTDQQKFLAKMERKRLNKDKVFYKKQNLNRTHSNGPRAVTK